LSLLVPMAFVESRNLEKHGPFLSDYFDWSPFFLCNKVYPFLCALLLFSCCCKPTTCLISQAIAVDYYLFDFAHATSAL
jgi:hypothetical protein